MNICFLTTSFLPEIGGMEIVIDRLASELKSMGHDPVVVAQLPRPGIEIPSFPYRLKHYSRLRSSVWFLNKIKRCVLREYNKSPIDIIHAQMAYPSGYIACLLKKKLNIPVVITSHQGDFRRYSKRAITAKRMRWALEFADASTGVSEQIKNAIDTFTGNKANSFVIPNGVDKPDSFSGQGQCPDAYKHLAKDSFVLTLGRLHKYKGLDVLIETLENLAKDGVDVPNLVIAGDGREGESLKKQSIEAGLASKIIFTGAVFGEEKHWLLKNCRFFLQPSRAEGMPLTVLEAMSYGKAVIGTAISGMCDLVKDSENGLLVQPESSEQLAKAIKKLLQNSELTKACGEKAYSVAEQYAWSNITERYLEIYQNVQ